MANCKSPKALVIISPGAEELEVISVTDTLSRGGVKVILGTLNQENSTSIKCAHGTILKGDALLKDIDITDIDAIIIPGGYQGSLNCRDSLYVGKLLKMQQSSGKLIGAICAAPGLVLANHGILTAQTKATGYPGTTSDIPNLVDEGVVVDKEHHLITAKGPAYGIAFGLALTRYLVSDEVANKVSDDMLYTECTK